MSNVRVLIDVACMYEYKDRIYDIIKNINDLITVQNHDDNYFILKNIKFTEFMKISMKISDITDYYQGYFINYDGNDFGTYKNDIISFAKIENGHLTTDKLKEDYEYFIHIINRK